ncbi:carbohydrate esterase family 8 protein [Lophiostoma macrostomum CBS 122681]|uniref:Pectinesterase n=1 Tax=Lophiostoma macrostomum CBS 122681 TaxID=1314788 RepID=A0A6A6T8L3_9PLEO|nr:carbohydrate esterase family 8 protein [Lophiostoma macrostomum CBS 122681]
MPSILSLLSLAATAYAASRTSNPDKCLEVGGSGSYSTVQAAVDALSTSSSTAQCIFINEGTYKEQVYIKSLKGALTLYGYTKDDTSYSGNTVTITYGGSQADGSTNDETAALRAWSASFSVYNINIVNSYGSGSQAVALSAEAATQGYYGCSFQGFQDTVLAETGTQFYAKSEIVGATDFIFGQTAIAWFDGVDLRVLEASLGYLTANGRDSESNPSYYVFNKGTIAAADGNSVKSGAYYLGRPWRDYARVIFQYTEMSDVINSAGWAEWQSSDTRTDHVYFGEYSNTGDGAKGTRASFAKTLSSPAEISTVLGSNYADWVDTSYLS